MANAAISSVVNKLSDNLFREASAIIGTRDDVEWLERKLRGMLCFLADAEAKRKGGNQRVQNWIRDIGDVAYDAEDVIEAFMLRVTYQPSEGLSMSDMADRFTHFFSSTKARYEIAKKIRKLRSRISDISRRRQELGIVELTDCEASESRMMADRIEARRRLHPHVYDASSVVGFVKEEEMIVDKLLDEERRRFVISIVGMGGLGKTTIARKVFYNDRILRHFVARNWVTVSQTYNVIELLKKLLKAVGGMGADDRLDEDDLKQKLYEALKARGRYLMVLDDVWDKQVWRRIETTLPDMGNGSRVIFTTRRIDVARSAEPDIPPHELRFLNEEESKSLFIKRVYPYRDVQAFEEDLEDLGEKLVESCRGLPLALEVLGGLLSAKDKTYVIWSSMLKKVKWQTAEEGKECLGIIGLSYEQLSSHIKPCYLYVGAFPEDYKIRTRRLTRLWIAEGFIPQRQGKSIEATAEDFLDELVQRCMVQVEDRRAYDGSVKTISIHDLLRDVCVQEARDCGLLNAVSLPAGDGTFSSNLVGGRRLVISSSAGRLGISSSDIGKSLIPNLRTLITFNNHSKYPRRMDPKRLQFLRVVDIQDVDIADPKSLIHLRYLRLRQGSISRLSLQHLHNLQVVDVRPHGVKVLFGRIRGSNNLKLLRDVRAGRWIGSVLRKLIHLEKLGITDIRCRHHNSLLESLGQLSSLVSLYLQAGGRDEHGSIPIEVLTMFSNHHHLHSLKLDGKMSQQQLPPYQQFPPNLTKLYLSCTRLEQDPMPVLERLPNLVCLKLGYAYKGKRMVCSSTGFPRLQRMTLDLQNLEEWTVEPGAMLRLSYLVTYSKLLKKLPVGLRSVSTLREFKLLYPSEELKRRVEKDTGEDWHIIQHIPSITITIE